MSRWSDGFERLQKSWADFRELSESVSVKDEAIISTVDELARMRKLEAYIDVLFNHLDCELLPQSKFDEVIKHINSCVVYIDKFSKDQQNSDLISLNTYLDNILLNIAPYIDGYIKLSEAHIKAIGEHGNLINAWIKKLKELFEATVEKSNESINKSNNLISDIDLKLSKINSYNEKLFGVNGIEESIDRIFSDFIAKNDEVSNYHGNLFGNSDKHHSIKSKINELKAEIETCADSIRNILDEHKDKLGKINGFYNRVFGVDDQGGLEKEMESLLSRANELNKEIESHLPKAVSIGLASAYSEMKKSFRLSIWLYSILFYSTIGIMIYISLPGFGGFDGVVLPAGGSGDNGLVYLVKFLYKLPILLPLAWGAYFASSRRSEASRLQQEYAHKEAIAKSYLNFKEQVQALKEEGDDLEKKLLGVAVDAIAFNASLTLDKKHGDSHPIQNMLETTKQISSNVASLVKRG